MNKKLLAVAVSGALAGIATAQADTANVNVYGKLYPEYTIQKTSGASAGGTNSDSQEFIQVSNSSLGFKGDADVGGGMKGWFQIESPLNFDTGGGNLAGRNSAVGLEGGFGNVFLGRWDTVYKQLGGPVSFLGLSSGNFVSNSNVFSRVGFGDRNRRTRFHERAANYIQYETPEMGGFQFLIGYSPDETLEGDDEGPDFDATFTSVGVKWESGPLYVALGHEIHDDVRNRGSGDIIDAADSVGLITAPAVRPHTKDTATRLSVGYEIAKGTKIGADFATMEWEAEGLGSYEKNAYALTLSHKIGNTSFAAEITKSEKGDCSFGGAACSTDGLGATQFSLGALHRLTKRVGLFALYSTIRNDENASFSNVEVDVSPGADTQAFGVGVLLRF